MITPGGKARTGQSTGQSSTDLQLHCGGLMTRQMPRISRRSSSATLLARFRISKARRMRCLQPAVLRALTTLSELPSTVSRCLNDYSSGLTVTWSVRLVPQEVRADASIVALLDCDDVINAETQINSCGRRGQDPEEGSRGPDPPRSRRRDSRVKENDLPSRVVGDAARKAPSDVQNGGQNPAGEGS